MDLMLSLAGEVVFPVALLHNGCLGLCTNEAVLVVCQHCPGNALFHSSLRIQLWIKPNDKLVPPKVEDIVWSKLTLATMASLFVVAILTSTAVALLVGYVLYGLKVRTRSYRYELYTQLVAHVFQKTRLA